MIALTTSYHKINSLTKPIRIIQGGQGAGKNFSIAIIWAQDIVRGAEFLGTVMTDTYDNLKDGAIKDLRTVFELMGIDFDNHYNKQDKEFHYNNSVVQFRYISDSRKTSGKSKRRDRLYINEANKIGWTTASSFISRSGLVWIDYNPDYEFWAHTEIPKLKHRETGEDLSEQIILTYLDNEFIPDNELDFILSRKNNKEWFRVYGLGLTGFYSERRIYSYEFIDKIPDTAKRIPSGMDFGVSPDPTIKIDVWNEDANLYVDEVFCENNLMPEKIKGAERMSVIDKLIEVNHPKGQLIIGDSAAGTSLRDMRKHGYNVIGVKKGAGSQIKGIRDLRAYNIFITKRSKSIKEGIEKWFFKVDKNDKIIPEPEGHEPDGLAALRYVVMSKKRW